MPPLPLPIRVLRDAVVVMVLIVIGQRLAELPYADRPPDPIMVQTFGAVFGTIGFAINGYFARARRALQMALSALALWLIAALALALGGGDPFALIVMLMFLPFMALLGAGLTLLVERALRE